MTDHPSAPDHRRDMAETHLRVRLSTRARAWLEAAAIEAEKDVETLARCSLEHEAQLWAMAHRLPPFDRDEDQDDE